MGIKSKQQPETQVATRRSKVKLCCALVSQQDNGWRKTDDELNIDKTGKLTITTYYYYYYTKNTSYDYVLEHFLPTASYYVRVYALDSGDKGSGL